MKMSVSVGRVADVLLTLAYHKSVLKCLNYSPALCSRDFASVAEGHEQILGVLSFSSVKGTDAIYIVIPARS